jgi:putative FmdB family regulatory protein
MPTYEYRCEKCEHEFEREQRITEDPIKKCPACGSLRARRLISATSFVLKGGGWYSDLYSSSKGRSDAGEKAESKSDAPAADSAKSASTPAASEGSSPKPKPKKAKPTAAA